MMQELISAANVAGLFNDRVFGQRADDEWTMLVVLAVERTGDENSIMAWCGKLTRLRVNKCCRSRADASKNLRKGEVSRNFFIATRFLLGIGMRFFDRSPSGDSEGAEASAWACPQRLGSLNHVCLAVTAAFVAVCIAILAAGQASAQFL